MCRLFGMSGGRQPVRATFWLLDAPDSLVHQSRRNPDGTGLGYFDRERQPVVLKQPIAAYEDRQFAQEAKEVSSRTSIAHVRYASGTPLTVRNTHPFVQDGRLFAHNGVIEDMPALERELGPTLSVVGGETDSERFFALVTREISRTGNVGEGIVAAARWIAEHLPVLSLNCVLITESELWALRYPDVHELHLLERAAGGASGHRHLDHTSATGLMRVLSPDLALRPAAILASERMDDNPTWRSLESGELVHVDADLNVTVTRPLDQPPAHQLTLADLEPEVASSQRAT